MKLRRAVRRAGAVSSGTLLAASACALVAAGAVDGAALSAPTLRVPAMAGVVLLTILVLVLVARRLRWQAPTARAQRVSFWLRAAGDLADVEVALALVAGAHAALAVTGGLTSPLYPLVYGLVAFAVTILSRPGAIACVGATLLLEVALGVRAAQGGAFDRETLVAVATHLIFLALAAAAHAVLLRGLAARWRRRRARHLAGELLGLRQNARDYRLIASALGSSSRIARPRDDEEQLLAIGGAETISDAAVWVLSTVKRSLGATTVAMVWLGDDGEQLVLKEIVSDVDELRDPGRLDAPGLLGAVVRDRAPVLIAATKAGHLPYYATERAGQAAVAVPILDGAHLRGVLCADRPRAFADADRELLLDASAQLLRTVQTEQVFRAVERAKYEHERFYQATALLGRALTPEQVMDTAFDAAAAIADFDLAIVTLYDRDAGKHRVTGVRTRPGSDALVDPAALDGLEFKDNAGLASMVVKNRHYLPAGGEPRDVTAPVFTRKVKLDDARSLLVLPLLAADEPVGTLTLAARGEKRFGKDVREMLAVIATQVAVALQNGLLYRRMETMATTDGLTGLTNHRTFQEKFAEVLERAGRHGHKAAVLLCDVDHFKKVNDTYGHPVGDEVLRRVARVLQEVARKIDITARYGGEEFVVVLDHADIEQARAVADRIRVEIGRLVMESDKGPFRVTQSIGVAAFPDDGRDRAALIEHADHALYHAKHAGRNRVVTYPEFLAARRLAGAAGAETARPQQVAS